MSNNVNTKLNVMSNHAEFLDIPEPNLILANIPVVPTTTEVYMKGGTKIKIERQFLLTINPVNSMQITRNVGILTATLSISGNILTTFVGGAPDITIDLTTYSTIQDVATYIDSNPNYNCSGLSPGNIHPAIDLMNVTGINIKGPANPILLAGTNAGIQHRISYDKGVTWSDPIETFPNIYNIKNPNLLTQLPALNLQCANPEFGTTASTVTITGNHMELYETVGGVPIKVFDFDLNNSTYNTLGKLIYEINNNTAGIFEANLDTEADEDTPSSYLANVTSVDIFPPAYPTLNSDIQNNSVYLNFNKLNPLTNLYDKWGGYVSIWEWNTQIKNNLVTAILPTLVLRNIGINSIKSYDDMDKLKIYYRTGAAASQDPDLESSGTWGNWTLLTEYSDFDYRYFQLKVAVIDSILKSDRTWIRHFALHRKGTVIPYLTDYWKCDNVSRDYSFNYIRANNRILLSGGYIPGSDKPYSGNPGGKYGGCIENSMSACCLGDTEIASCLNNSNGSIEFYFLCKDVLTTFQTLFDAPAAIKIQIGSTAGSVQFILNGAETYNTPSLTPNQWYHALLVWANGQHPKLYMNNVLVYTWTLTAPLSAITSVRFINSSGATPLDNFDGKLDEIKFYNQAII